MKKAFGFTLMDVTEFSAWLDNLSVARTVLYVQQHHTYRPGYAHFKKDNHIQLQKNMKNHHVNNNGWSDIGQHFTIFPDGMIATGRSMERTPACIYGRNSHSICIENLGDFDTGKDRMTSEQSEAIVAVTALLCKRFDIPVDTDKIVYHHWFDLGTGARTTKEGRTKSCPGTNFFGGNSIKNCLDNFIPLVKQWNGGVITSITIPKVGYGVVSANRLNIRSSNSSKSKIVGTTTLGSVLRLDKREGNWYKISSTNDEWVYSNFVKIVERATVNASVLNVRSGPSKNFPKVSAVEKDQEVFVYERDGKWSRINFGEEWVFDTFLTLKS